MRNSAGPLPPGVAGSGRGGTDRSAAARFESAKSETAFRTISEVSELLETPAHVLRFWESRFPQVRPVKRAGGRRYYRPADVALLAGIRKLLHDDGLAIRGVQKMLRDQGVKAVSAPEEAAEVAGPEAGLEAGGPRPEAPAAPLAEPAPDRAPDPVAAPLDAAPSAADPVPLEEAPPAPDDAAAATAGDLAAEPLEQALTGPVPPDRAPEPPSSPNPGALEGAREAPAEDSATVPADATPDAPPRPRVLIRRRSAEDAPGLFSLMDAPEVPPPAAEPDRDAGPPAEDAQGRPLAALLRAASPALLAPHAKALAAIHARLEAIKARRDCAGRGR